MKLKKGKPTKKSEFGITIQKSLSANIKSNSVRFFTNEMKMIAQLRYNQARNILLKKENVIKEEQEAYINEFDIQREAVGRKNVIMNFGGLINKVFRGKSGYEIEYDDKFQIPVIKFRHNTYILFTNPFKEDNVDEKMLQFKILDKVYNNLEAS